MTIQDATAIVGIGQTEWGKGLEDSELVLALRAIKAALDDAGVEPSEVDGLSSYTLETSNEVVMRVGDTTSVGGYAFRMTDLREIKGANYVAEQGTFDVTYGDKKIATMAAQKRLYTVQNMPMTEAAIHRRFTRDLYISMGEAASQDSWIVRVQHKPFMSWIWFGCLFMAFGGFLAASDRRYRMASRKQKLATQEAPGAKPVNAAA